MKNQILVLSEEQEKVIYDNQEKDSQIQLLKRKNQELLVQLQNLEIQLENIQSGSEVELVSNNHINNNINNMNNMNSMNSMKYKHPNHRQQYTSSIYPINSHPLSFYPSSRSPYQSPSSFQPYQSFRFSQKIQKQMQTMIKKLLKQLSYEKKSNSKLHYQIKKLNNQIIESEKKIKGKNDQIYQLEMKIISLEKQKSNNNSNSLTPYGKTNIVNTNTNINVNKKNVNENISQFTYTPNHTKSHSRVASQLNNNNNNNNTEQNQQIPPNINNNNKISLNILANRIKARQQKQIIINPNINIIKSSINNNTNSLNVNNSNNMQRKAMIKNTTSHNNVKNDSRIANSSPYIKRSNELNEIQNNKNNINNNNNITTNKTQSQSNTSSNSSRMFSSFSLMYIYIIMFFRQLQQNPNIKITMTQKFIIICRLIQFYIKKLSSSNYLPLLSQQLIISNFHQKHPNLIRIRLHQSNESNNLIQNQQQSQQSMLWNMVFIIENVMKEVDAIDEKDINVDLNFVQIIEELMEKNKQEKIMYFQELVKYLQKTVA